jgi:Double-GTPase 2
MSVDKDLKESPKTLKPVESGKSDEPIVIWTGEGLDESDANRFMREVACRPIVFIGGVKSGKTTLIAAIWEKFSAGEHFGWVFAGSRTLVGFENRCFLSRSESEGELPDTERTGQHRQGTFLHLCLHSFTQGIDNILLYDVTGESFREAIDSSDACRGLEVLRQADHINFVLDGAKLMDIGVRQQERAAVTRLLLRCLDNGMITPDSNVTVIVSKWDLIYAKIHSNDPVFRFIETIETDLRRITEGRIQSYNFCRVASRGSQNLQCAVQFGTGLDTLFDAWKPRIRQSKLPQLKAATTSIDMFGAIIREQQNA